LQDQAVSSPSMNSPSCYEVDLQVPWMTSLRWFPVAFVHRSYHCLRRQSAYTSMNLLLYDVLSTVIQNRQVFCLFAPFKLHYVKKSNRAYTRGDRRRNRSERSSRRPSRRRSPRLYTTGNRLPRRSPVGCSIKHVYIVYTRGDCRDDRRDSRLVYTPYKLTALNGTTSQSYGIGR